MNETKKYYLVVKCIDSELIMIRKKVCDTLSEAQGCVNRYKLIDNSGKYSIVLFDEDFETQ